MKKKLKTTTTTTIERIKLEHYSDNKYVTLINAPSFKKQVAILWEFVSSEGVFFFTKNTKMN